MLHRARQHIGDRLDPPMRVPREPRHVVPRPVPPEIVEEQERVGLRRVLKAEGAVQMHASPFDMRFGAAGFDDGTDGHEGLLKR